MNISKLKANGFSLVEMAIVLVILGLLLGGVLALVGPQRDVQMVRETETEIQSIQDALISVAIQSPTGSLPCPDNHRISDPLYGQPDQLVAGACPSLEGWVPFVALGGVGRRDAWGNRFRYRVVPGYSGTSTYNLSTALSAAETLNVCSRPACGNGQIVATNVVAVILSHGRNGFGSRNWELDTFRAQPPAATDEFENTNGRNAADTNALNNAQARVFVSRDPSLAGTLGGEFDDVVGWIPQAVLHSKMLAAARLP